MTTQPENGNGKKVEFLMGIMRTFTLALLGWLALSMIGVKEDVASLKASVNILLAR